MSTKVRTTNFFGDCVKECAKKKFGVGFRGGFSLFLSFGDSKRKKKIEKCNSMFRTVMPCNYVFLPSNTQSHPSKASFPHTVSACFNQYSLDQLLKMSYSVRSQDTK
jgi:hypothetical protein